MWLEQLLDLNLDSMDSMCMPLPTVLLDACQRARVLIPWKSDKVFQMLKPAMLR